MSLAYRHPASGAGILDLRLHRPFRQGKSPRRCRCPGVRTDLLVGLLGAAPTRSRSFINGMVDIPATGSRLISTHRYSRDGRRRNRVVAEARQTRHNRRSHADDRGQVVQFASAAISASDTTPPGPPSKLGPAMFFGAVAGVAPRRLSNRSLRRFGRAPESPLPSVSAVWER